MTNAELIKVLKDAEMYIRYVAPSCIASSEAIEAIRAAADALEAAEKRVNEMTTKCSQLQAEVDNYEKRIAELEAQLQNVTERHTLEEGER